MMKQHRSGNALPALVLFFLSPVLAELFLGSTSLSKAQGLFLESFFYGSGALLVRETARRFRMGWTQMILLGLAYGMIEEGLSLQSVFNRHFLGFEIGYGRLWGVNWVWGLVIITYHALWSITIPVFFAELLFPARRSVPWLNKAGITTMVIFFVLSGVAFFLIFYRMSGFTASWIHLTVMAMLVTGTISMAFSLPIRPKQAFRIRKPAGPVTALMAFTAACVWFFILDLVYLEGHMGLPAWVPLSLAAGIASLMFFLGRGWSEQEGSDLFRFFLASGALMASMGFGLFTLIQSGNKLDIISQSIFIMVTVSALSYLGIRLRKEQVNNKT